MGPDDDYARFDALIFEGDGTLADTMPAHYRVWVEVLARHGIAFDKSTFYAWGGVPAVEVTRRLAEAQGVAVDAAAVAHEKEERFALVGTENVQPVVPVIELARRHVGVKPMAVATGGLRAVCTKLLDGLHVADWFEAVVTADDVTHGKPHPETYARAAERLGVEPARCVAFEDADPGLESATAAGMTAVDVRPWLR